MDEVLCMTADGLNGPEPAAETPFILHYFSISLYSVESY